MNFLKIVLLACICLGLGLIGGYYLSGMVFKTDKAEIQPTARKGEGDRKILFYRNPMNPEITSPVPKKDEMGMDYVPVYKDGTNLNEPAGTVKIDPVVEQNMGVRTASATIREMGKIIHTYGRVTYDEDKIYSLYPRYKGWIDKVYVSRTGDRIKEGQYLVSIYSPELVSTQQDYLLALRGLKTLSQTDIAIIRDDAQALLGSAQKRLRLFGIGEREIARLESSNKASTSLPIASNVTGTVLKVAARQGDFVTPATELYRIADLSAVWVLAEVYESDFPWIEVGDQATISFSADNGEKFSGKVDFIYPFENAHKKTVQTRIVLQNRHGILRPAMFVNVSIETSPKRAIFVPSEAVIKTGTRQLVFVKKGQGHYEPKPVTTGISSQGYTEVLKGLSPGEVVVISGQFLIDSESKLREATLKMIPPENGKEVGKMKMDPLDDKKNN